MCGCFTFDENPAVVSLRTDRASYWICSLVRAKVSRMYGSEYGAFYIRRRSVWQSHELCQFNETVKTVFLSIILVLQTYLVISDDRAGKAGHTPCYLIVCGFKRRQRSTSPRLASVFIRAVSNTKLCRPCFLKYIVKAEGSCLRGP